MTSDKQKQRLYKSDVKVIMSRMDSGKSPRISTPGRPGPRKLPLYSPSERSPFRFETLSINQHFNWNISVSMMTLSRFSPLILSSKMVSFPVSRFMVLWKIVLHTKIGYFEVTLFYGQCVCIKDWVRALSISFNFNKFQFLGKVFNWSLQT